MHKSPGVQRISVSVGRLSLNSSFSSLRGYYPALIESKHFVRRTRPTIRTFKNGEGSLEYNKARIYLTRYTLWEEKGTLTVVELNLSFSSFFIYGCGEITRCPQFGRTSPTVETNW